MAFQNNTKVGKGASAITVASSIPKSPARKVSMGSTGEGIDRKSSLKGSKAPIDRKKAGMA